MRLSRSGFSCSILWLATFAMMSCGQGKRSTPPSPSVPPSESGPQAPQSPLPPESAPQPSPVPGNNDVVSQQQFMIFHNLKRCWHDAPKISWDSELVAKSATIAKDCSLEYWEDGISSGHGVGLGLIQALDQWYLEGMIFFPYGKNEIPASMKRFSAMVWKETRKMGCSHTKCGAEDYYVCAYSQGLDAKKAAVNVGSLKPDFLGCSGL